jgi:COP9 signalosome complex subunit 6
MPEDTKTENTFVSDRPSDSNLTVSLHPLVLLTLSDHITRHQVRGYSGNIVGALLGQQKGREITLEHAFECNVQIDEQNQANLQTQWFEDRLQQCELVWVPCTIHIANQYRQGCAQSPSPGPCRLVHIMSREWADLCIPTNPPTIPCPE